MKLQNILFNKITVITIAYVITFVLISASFMYEAKEIENFAFFRLVMFLLFFPLFVKYFLHIVLAPWYDVSSKIADRKNKNIYKPKVSVIVPAWNEEVGIASTMNSILNNSYKNIELIVVNDGSTDNTEQEIKKYIENYKGLKKIKYIKKNNGGKSSAMNQGVKESSGEIILTTDADSLLDVKAVENMVKRFDAKEVTSVAGNVKVGNGHKLISDIQKLEYHYGFYFKRADSLLNSIYIVGGAAAAYRREVFDELGYFDEDIITEDIEYSTRILNAGYRIRYASDAIFYTEAPTEFEGLIKQRLRWKYGRLMTFMKYRNLFFSLEKKHSKFLTHLILPVALLGEMLLLFEILLLPIFYTYVLLTKDFLPLIFAMIFLAAVILMQVIAETKSKKNWSIIKFAPIAWIIFYFIDFIEYIALIKSLNKILKKKKVEWQKWERKGVFG